MRPIILLMTFISMTMALTGHSQEVLSARITRPGERSAMLKASTTNIAVQLKDPIQPLLGIRLLRVTTNSAVVANLVSGERCEMRLLIDRIDTKAGLVELESIDEQQETANFKLVKGLHSAMPTGSMLMPNYFTNSISVEQPLSPP